MRTKPYGLKMKVIVAADLDELVAEANEFLGSVTWADVEVINNLPINVFGLYVMYTD